MRAMLKPWKLFFLMSSYKLTLRKEEQECKCVLVAYKKMHCKKKKKQNRWIKIWSLQTACCILTRAVQKRCTGGCGSRSIPSCGWRCAGCLCLSSLLHPGSSTQPEPGDETFMEIKYSYWRKVQSLKHICTIMIWLRNLSHWSSCRQCWMTGMAVGLHDVAASPAVCDSLHPFCLFVCLFVSRY